MGHCSLNAARLPLRHLSMSSRVRPGDRTLRIVPVEHVCSPAHVVARSLASASVQKPRGATPSLVVASGGATGSRTQPARLSGVIGQPVHLAPSLSSTVGESNSASRLIRPATAPAAGGWYPLSGSNRACRLVRPMPSPSWRRGHGRRRGDRTRQRVFPKHVAHPEPCLR